MTKRAGGVTSKMPHCTEWAACAPQRKARSGAAWSDSAGESAESPSIYMSDVANVPAGPSMPSSSVCSTHTAFGAGDPAARLKQSNDL